MFQQHKKVKPSLETVLSASVTNPTLYQHRTDAFHRLRYIVSGRIFLPHTVISIEVSYVKRLSERHGIVRKKNSGEMLTEKETEMGWDVRTAGGGASRV